MLRFLSKKRGRHGHKTINHVKNDSRNHPQNKHSIHCKVILLDGTDLSVNLSVSISDLPFFKNTPILYELTINKYLLLGYFRKKLLVVIYTSKSFIRWI